MTDQSQVTPEPEPSKNVPSSHKDWALSAFDILKQIAIVLILYLIADSIIARVRVENISMYPTVQPGEILVVNRLAYKLGHIKRGDIITFHYPLAPKLDYIKRVIGLPGDTVQAQGHKIFVNGYLFNESYLVNPMDYEGQWEVPLDSIFVLGDNRNDSADSHVWGFVPLKNIIGKVLAVYWPIDHFRLIQYPDIFMTISK